MTVQDILDASTAQYGSRFTNALAIVLPDECVFAHDGVTIIGEHPDSHGLTVAGLNQQDDGLPVDENGNCTASPLWIATGYFSGNPGTPSIGYWKPIQCSSLPSPVGECLFVQAVNQGDNQEVKLLQQALNSLGAHLVIDGKMGTNTQTAAWKFPPLGITEAFLNASASLYQEIATDHPQDQDDLAGWLNRVQDLRSRYLS